MLKAGYTTCVNLLEAKREGSVRDMPNVYSRGVGESEGLKVSADHSFIHLFTYLFLYF